MPPSSSNDATADDASVTTAETMPEKSHLPTRAYASHEPAWDRFGTTSVYERQYTRVYDVRIETLVERCWENAPEGVKIVKRVLDVQEGVRCAVAGTIIKDSDKDGKSLAKDSYCTDCDSLFLEDQYGRMILKMEENKIHHYCTGLVLGVVGIVDELGRFCVEQVIEPAPMPHPKVKGELIVASSPDGEEGKQSSPKILLVSGLHCADPNSSSVTLDMLASYLEGQFTMDAKNVCRVVIAGGGPSLTDPLEGVRSLDAWLARVMASHIPVDILPGKSEPTTANWPQRPLHASLFAASQHSPLLGRSPNPYGAEIGGKYIVGTSGENIKDLCKSIMVDKPKEERDEDDKEMEVDDEGEEKQEESTLRTPEELEGLERTLRWGHICPTGPNTVPTVPHLEDDPMVLESTPHIYFSGGCAEPAWSVVDRDGEIKTLLACVPTFSSTGKAMLVDLESLDVEILNFEDDTAE